MDKYQNKYRILTNRLLGYDYGANGLYFVTICTKDRLHYFGEIVETDDYLSDNAKTVVETGDCPSERETGDCLFEKEPDNHLALRGTQMGAIARQYWSEIPQHFPFVELDEFVIMPNHIHGILLINKSENTDWQPNVFGRQSRNLGSVIRGFKSSVKRYANQNNIEFEWQSRYHDRIVRDERELNAIRNYIINNPAHWSNDELNNNPA